ncbi:hypothetical protein PIB30_100391 [Stylosanthes scabra]|uniref:Uncharacterized protein n=1 Tax=Stylosanthes scabra TaxID=79078 RepID=A0ABU6UZ24_9FABA|nr:hypothetical protein [Stylosanthes scabra]
MHILNFTDRSPDTSGWGRILQASGIPEDLTSAETAIWACSWLSHSGGFSRNIFGPMGDEDTLRMRLASSIVAANALSFGSLLMRPHRPLGRHLSGPSYRCDRF